MNWIADARCPLDDSILVQQVNGSIVVDAPATKGLAAPPDAAEVLAEGTVVGEYQIERMIGFGGMGVVYAARHPVIGKRAAIKVLSARYSADREAVARFVQEAQAVNQIGHTNIVDVFAFGALPDGRSYFVMELLQGETLQDRVERAPFLVTEAIRVLVALTRALEAAHAAGVIHRDLKPENVFLVRDDEDIRVKLLDFGIAKLSSARPIESRTATGFVVGTPLFMSPEQARGLHLDHRTDLYSLGVLAYAMVCGVTPFEGEPSAVEVLSAHIAKPPRPPRELAPDLPAAFETVILELLAKRPDDRPSLAEVRRRLTRLATDPIALMSGEHPVQPPQMGGGADRRSSMISGTEIVGVEPRRSRVLVWAALGACAFAAFTFVLVRQLAGTESRANDRRDTALAVHEVPVRAEQPASARPPAPDESASKLGTVEIVIDPVDARTRIDDRPISLARGKTRVELAPGRHVLTSSAPGYAPTRHAFDVLPSNITPLTIRLRRSPPPRTLKKATSSKKAPGPDPDAALDPFAAQKRTR